MERFLKRSPQVSVSVFWPGELPAFRVGQNLDQVDQVLWRKFHEFSLTGFNRCGVKMVTFLVTWVCISVPFCALRCTFSTEGKTRAK